MKTTDKITIMEQLLERSIVQASSITSSSNEYAEYLDLILRLQDTILKLRHINRLQETNILKETF